MTTLDGILIGSALDAQVFEPLRWCVEGIIPEGTGLLVAPPKAGKSWLVAGIGLACAAGGVALGNFPVYRRPVLYLALEDGPRRLQDRFRRLMGGDPIPDIGIITNPEGVLDVIGKFFDHYKEDQPLVILDTLGKVMRPRNNGPSYLDDYRQASSLMRMQQAAPGSTLLIVHHTRKQESADFVHTASGTTGITGAVDFVVTLVRDRNETDAVLNVTGRDVPEDRFALKFSDGLWTIDTEGHKRASDAADRQRFSENTIRVLYLVRGRLETRPADVGEVLGIDAKRASEILIRLAERGLIRKVERGTYGPAEPAGSAESAGQEATAIPHSGTGAETRFRTGDLTAERKTASELAIPHNPHNPQRVGDDTHSPGPGHSSISTPAGGATIGDAGVGNVPKRQCKTAGCTDLATMRARCDYCNQVEAALRRHAPTPEVAEAAMKKFTV